MASDDVRTLSEALAADPSSLVFLQLGEALRRRGDLDVALLVALRGVERHPQLADAHDLAARVAADRGDLDRAVAEWETVLQYAPDHIGARKGLGFVCFQLGRLADAAAHLGVALAANPADASLAAAIQTVQAALSERTIAAERATVPVNRAALPPESARAEVDAGALFDDLLEGQHSAALLLDADGLVLAGRYQATDGRDLAADVGAQLSGVSDEASRAMRHLGLGAWRQIVFETEAASVAMAPSRDGVLLVAAARPIPLGFVRRVLERALDRANSWLGSA
ncbi:MAG TPA: tetratricopeptide repeat protein [Gemmatimonadaceae bacterium]